MNIKSEKQCNDHRYTGCFDNEDDDEEGSLMILLIRILRMVMLMLRLRLALTASLIRISALSQIYSRIKGKPGLPVKTSAVFSVAENGL